MKFSDSFITVIDKEKAFFKVLFVDRMEPKVRVNENNIAGIFRLRNQKKKSLHIISSSNASDEHYTFRSTFEVIISVECRSLYQYFKFAN